MESLIGVDSGFPLILYSQIIKYSKSVMEK